MAEAITTPKNMIFIFHVDVTGIYSVRPHEIKHENTSGDFRRGPFLGTVRQKKRPYFFSDYRLVMTGTIRRFLSIPQRDHRSILDLRSDLTHFHDSGLRFQPQHVHLNRFLLSNILRNRELEISKTSREEFKNRAQTTHCHYPPTMTAIIRRACCTAALFIAFVRSFQNNLFLSRNRVKSISTAAELYPTNYCEVDSRQRKQFKLKSSEESSNESISRGFLPSGPGDLAPIENGNSGDLRNTVIRSKHLTISQLMSHERLALKRKTIRNATYYLILTSNHV